MQWLTYQERLSLPSLTTEFDPWVQINYILACPEILFYHKAKDLISPELRFLKDQGTPQAAPGDILSLSALLPWMTFILPRAGIKVQATTPSSGLSFVFIHSL